MSRHKKKDEIIKINSNLNNEIVIEPVKIPDSGSDNQPTNEMSSVTTIGNNPIALLA